MVEDTYSVWQRVWVVPCTWATVIPGNVENSKGVKHTRRCLPPLSFHAVSVDLAQNVHKHILSLWIHQFGPTLLRRHEAVIRILIFIKLFDLQARRDCKMPSTISGPLRNILIFSPRVKFLCPQ